MKRTILALFLIIGYLSTIYSQNSPFDGKWKLIKGKGSVLDYFGYMHITISTNKNELTILKEFGPKRKSEEKMTIPINGKTRKIEIHDASFSTNLYMGLRKPVEGFKEVSSTSGNNNLNITEKYDVQSSQGSKEITVIHKYELSQDKNIITYTIQRDSRKTGPETKYILKRYDYRNAYTMKLNDDWDINSKLPEQACLTSLQGLVNEDKANLYFTFGPKFPFNYTEDLYNFLENERYFTFTRINTLDQALSIFQNYVKGYVVWDKNVRTSLIVAYTLAGLEKGIVISEELIPLMKKYGFRQIDDFRGRFTRKNDFEIYTWAKEKYWGRCNKELIIWLGGVHGSELMPNIADYGMMKNVFFTDLSARETDTLEYNLTKSLLADMKPLSYVMGWHSYKKDLEEEWVTLTSSFALTVDGLNTLPNTSFLYKVPPTPGFKFKNKHNIKPGQKYIPENKVYLALVQTDGLGLGAWVKPGRGSIPYSWEVSMNFHWLSPCMLEYFYSQATPNDYFIGCLSGSAYMYPKAFPKKWLPKEIEKAKKFMDILDLNVFEIMDYSEDKTEAGENNLTKEIVEEYYKGMPDAIGFLNGYFASNTFTVKDKKPFISYDYYLSAEKTEEEAAADLTELAEISSVRPYFLLVHVRESSDVARVKSICDKLGKGIEITPLDIFLKMAGENPTYKEWFLEKKR